MAQVDAQEVASRLVDEQRDLWIHLESDSPLEKYPGTRNSPTPCVETKLIVYVAKQHARLVAQSLDVTEGVIYLAGTPRAFLEDSDQFVPFRQRRYFYYLSGVDEPNCHVLYNVDTDVLTLLIPPIDAYQVVWFGRGSNREEALQRYDVDKVKWATRLIKRVEKELKNSKGKLYLLHPPEPRYGIDKLLPRIESSQLQAAMDRCRVIKDPHEIKLIRKANEVSARAHSAVLERISVLKNEAEVEAIFKNEAITHGSKHQAYPIIAGSGSNAAILHYTKNNQPLAGRQLLVLDAGAEYDCYASDVTRTLPLGNADPGKFGGWPSKEAAEIYSLVLKMQTECIKRLKPGVLFRDIHVLAHAILIRGFLELGIFTGSEEEIMRQAVSVVFFPHGLGHHLGLEVHDVLGVPIWLQKTAQPADLLTNEASNRIFKEAGFPHLCDPMVSNSIVNTSMTHKVDIDAPSFGLLENMVLTVEPGIYFHSYALAAFLRTPGAKYINKDVLERYMPVGGVRIEDDIQITHNGHENLTTAPKAVTHLGVSMKQHNNQFNSLDETESFRLRSASIDSGSGLLNPAQHAADDSGVCMPPNKSDHCGQQDGVVIHQDAPMKDGTILDANPNQNILTSNENHDLGTKFSAFPPSNGNPGQIETLDDRMKELQKDAEAMLAINVEVQGILRKALRPSQLDAKFNTLIEKFHALPRRPSDSDWMCIEDFYDAFAAMRSRVPREWRRSNLDGRDPKTVSVLDIVMEELNLLHDRMEERYKKLLSAQEELPEQKTLSPSPPRKRAAETALPIRTRDAKRGKTLFEGFQAGSKHKIPEDARPTLWQSSILQRHEPTTEETQKTSDGDRAKAPISLWVRQNNYEHPNFQPEIWEPDRPFPSSSMTVEFVERMKAMQESQKAAQGNARGRPEAARQSEENTSGLDQDDSSVPRTAISNPSDPGESAGTKYVQPVLTKESAVKPIKARRLLQPCAECVKTTTWCAAPCDGVTSCPRCKAYERVCIAAPAESYAEYTTRLSRKASTLASIPTGPVPVRPPAVPAGPGAHYIPSPPIGPPPPLDLPLHHIPPPPPEIWIQPSPMTPFKFAPSPHPPPSFPRPPIPPIYPFLYPGPPQPAGSIPALGPAEEESWDVMACNECSARGMKCELDHFNAVKHPRKVRFQEPPAQSEVKSRDRKQLTEEEVKTRMNEATAGSLTEQMFLQQPQSAFQWQIPRCCPTPSPPRQGFPYRPWRGPRPEMLGVSNWPYPTVSTVAKPSISGPLPSVRHSFGPDNMQPPNEWDDPPMVYNPRAEQDLAADVDETLKSPRLVAERPKLPPKPEEYRRSLGSWVSNEDVEKFGLWR